jgi:hypothetical protein
MVEHSKKIILTAMLFLSISILFGQKRVKYDTNSDTAMCGVFDIQLSKGKRGDFIFTDSDNSMIFQKQKKKGQFEERFDVVLYFSVPETFRHGNNMKFGIEEGYLIGFKLGSGEIIESKNRNTSFGKFIRKTSYELEGYRQYGLAFPLSKNEFELVAKYGIKKIRFFWKDKRIDWHVLEKNNQYAHQVINCNLSNNKYSGF